MPSSGTETRQLSLIVVALVLLRVVIAILAIWQLQHTDVSDEDVLRFHEVASDERRPWVDAELEYAPVEWGAIRLIGGADPAATGSRLVVLAFVADLAAAAAVGVGWGRAAMQRYLWLGAPMLLIAYLRFDLVVVALAAWGIVLARRRWARTAGAVLGLAVLAKIWPLVVVPGLLLVAGGRRALAWAGGVAGVGLGLWLAYAGADGVRQVVSFRGATGWGAESAIGTIVWIVTGEDVRLEAGAPRVGAVPGWVRVALGAVLVLAVVLVWWRASLERPDRRLDPFGRPALGGLGALLSLTPLFSLQYAMWLQPWAAVAGADVRATWSARLAAVVLVFTGVLTVMYQSGNVTRSPALLVARAIVVAALPVVAIVSTLGATDLERPTV